MRWQLVPFLVVVALPACGRTAEDKCVEACERDCPERGCEYCSAYGEACIEEADVAYDCVLDALDEAEDVCDPPVETCLDAFRRLDACDQAGR